MPRISQMFTDEYGNPTSIPMKICQAWEVEDEQVKDYLIISISKIILFLQKLWTKQ